MIKNWRCHYSTRSTVHARNTCLRENLRRSPCFISRILSSPNQSKAFSMPAQHHVHDHRRLLLRAFCFPGIFTCTWTLHYEALHFYYSCANSTILPASVADHLRAAGSSEPPNRRRRPTVWQQRLYRHLVSAESKFTMNCPPVPECIAVHDRDMMALSSTLFTGPLLTFSTSFKAAKVRPVST